MIKFSLKSILWIVPWLFAVPAFGTPQPVVLSNPASVGVASLTLNWTEPVSTAHRDQGV